MESLFKKETFKKAIFISDFESKRLKDNLAFRFTIVCSQRTCSRTVCVPYLNLCEADFLITTRQKLKVKLYSDRAMSIL